MNKNVAFYFNDKLVIVDKFSDKKDIVEKWWIDRYRETPEESYKKR